MDPWVSLSGFGPGAQRLHHLPENLRSETKTDQLLPLNSRVLSPLRSLPLAVVMTLSAAGPLVAFTPGPRHMDHKCCCPLEKPLDSKETDRQTRNRKTELESLKAEPEANL